MKIYLLAGLLWGTYATRVNLHLHREHARPVAAFTVNALFWPVAIPVAIFTAAET